MKPKTLEKIKAIKKEKSNNDNSAYEVYKLTWIFGSIKILNKRHD